MSLGHIVEAPAPVQGRQRFRRGKHTDTIHRPLPGKYGKIWEVGGKTKTQKTWENIGNPFICGPFRGPLSPRLAPPCSPPLPCGTAARHDPSFTVETIDVHYWRRRRHGSSR
eukprot:4849731-Pyramimonas_sp.AAC.1